MLFTHCDQKGAETWKPLENSPLTDFTPGCELCPAESRRVSCLPAAKRADVFLPSHAPFDSRRGTKREGERAT